MTLGAIVCVVGFPGIYYIADGSAAFDHYTALLAFPAALILLVSGPVILWRTRRVGGSRRRRYALRALSVAIAVVAVPLIFILIVFPIAFPYGYVQTGHTTSVPNSESASRESLLRRATGSTSRPRTCLRRTAPR